MEKTEPGEQEYDEKCVYFEEDVMKMQVKYYEEDLKNTRAELLALQMRHKLCDGRLQTALDEAKSAAAKAASNFSLIVQKLKQKVKAVRAESEEKMASVVLELQKENQILRAEVAARNAAIAQVHMLQEQIQSLRAENENLLTTIQDNFTMSRNADQIIEDVAEICDKLSQNKSKNLEQNQSFQDESYTKFWDTEDDDDEEDDHLEEDSYLVDKNDVIIIDSAIGENNDLPSDQESLGKVCLWIESDQEPCHEIFKSVQELKTHVKTEHAALANACLWQNCTRKRKMFLKKCGLMSHIKGHFAAANISTFLQESDDCGSTFGRKSELDNHSQKEIYPCHYPGCDKAYTRKYNLKNHERHAHNFKSYQCPFPKCGKMCKSSKEFTEHRSQHNTGEKLVAKNACHDNRATRFYKDRLQCTFPGCNRKFRSSICIGRHNDLHTSGKSFSCPICRKMFSNQRAFDLHKDMHNHGFRCTFKGCKKSYTNMGNMLRHKNSHETVKM